MCCPSRRIWRSTSPHTAATSAGSPTRAASPASSPTAMPPKCRRSIARSDGARSRSRSTRSAPPARSSRASTPTARRTPSTWRAARAAGAAGVLVFPPTLFMWGAQLKPDMVLRHFSEIAAGADLPIVVFEYPPASGIGYSPDTLARLAEIPQVAAVKDWSNEIVAFEANLRALRATGRPVAMLSAFTMSLMATFLLGADGAISGMGSVTADLQAELFEACGKGDLDGARRINDRLAPLVSVFYAPPFVDMHNRMKEALVLLGRLPAAHVRPPLTPVSGAEREAIRRALVAAGLL